MDKIPKWLIFMMLPVIVLATLGTNYYLAQHSFFHFSGERSLTDISDDADRISALKWRTLFEKKLDPATADEINALEQEISTRIDELHSVHLDVDVTTKVHSSFTAYSKALTDVFNLLATGQIDTAVSFDKNYVEPAYNDFNNAVFEAELRHDGIIERQTVITYAGSLAITLLSLFLIVFLFWSYERQRHKAETTETEKKILLSSEKRLKESEKRYRGLFDNLNDAAFLADIKSGIIIETNSMGEKLLGLPREKIIGMHQSKLHPPGKEEEYSSKFTEHVEKGHAVDYDGEIVTADGKIIPVSINASTYMLEGKKMILGLFRDILERKQSEDKILKQSAELENRNRELSTLYHISSVIGRTIDRDTLFENVMNAITSLDIFPVQKRGGFFMIENNRLELAYHIGKLSDEFLELHENLKVGQCLCGMAAESGEVVVSCNAGDDSKHTIKLRNDDPHGHVIIPLKTIDSVIGVLFLYLQPDFKVDDVLMQMLSTIGNQLGVALDNACHYEEVKIQSLHDPLTGLANRRLMAIELERNIAAASRFKRPFSVMMLDIDFFKDYNDTLGHAAGDKLLMSLADIVLSELREVDLVVRYGGEEFLVILPETDTAEAVATAERIRKKIMNTEFHYDKKQPPRHVTVSFGVSSFADSVSGDAELIALADKALYEAKESGRNNVKAAA